MGAAALPRLALEIGDAFLRTFELDGEVSLGADGAVELALEGSLLRLHSADLRGQAQLRRRLLRERRLQPPYRFALALEVALAHPQILRRLAQLAVLPAEVRLEVRDLALVALAEGGELVGGEEELLALGELVRFRGGELARERLVRGLEVGALGALLGELGVEAGGVGGAGGFDGGDLGLEGLEAVVGGGGAGGCA